MHRYPTCLRIAQLVAVAAGAVAYATLLAAPAARAATENWSGAGTDTLWSDPNNWSSGTVPGATTGTTDTDEALFNSSTFGIQSTVTLDTPRNLQFIYFDTAAGSYTIIGAGPNSLLLTSGGMVSILPTFTSADTNIETIDAPLVLEGTSTSSGTIADNATTGAMLDFGGAISSGAAGLGTLTVSGVGGITIGGQISTGVGPLGLIKTGGGYLFLTNGGDSYTNGTQVADGVLNFVSGAFGAGTITGSAGEIQYAAGNAQDISQQFIAGGVGVDTNGNNVNWASAMTASNWPTTNFLKFGAGTLEISGANTGLSAMGTQSGTALSIYGGTLDLDFTANPGAADSKVPAGRALALFDGTLKLNGNATMASSQSFANGSGVGFSGATAGNSEVMLVNNGAGILLSLGSVGVVLGQTYNFVLPGNGTDGNPGTGGNADQTATNGVRTTTLNTAFTGGTSPATILGGWATVNGATWAVSSNTAGTNNITGLSSYSGSFTAGADVDSPAGTSAPAAATYNSWRFNSAGSYTINPAGNITIASDGILETANVGANPVTIDIAGTSNELISGYGAQLIVHQNNLAGTMTINSLIAGGIFTKSGAGTVLLANPNNSYGSGGGGGATSGTFISGGFDASGNPIFGDLEVPSDPNFDSTSFYLGAVPTNAAAGANNIVLTNGILQFANGASGNNMTLAANRGIGLNGMGGGIDTGNNTVNYGGVISNTSLNSTSNPGNFTKLGSGTLILTGLNTYTGYTAIDNGTLQLNYSTLSTSSSDTPSLILYSGGTAGPLVLGGGTLQVLGSEIQALYGNQPFASLTVNAGQSAIAVSGGSGGGATAITLNAITRNPGGTVDFTLPSGTPAGNNGIITITPNADFAGGQATILGGWATVGGFSTWAVSGGSGDSITGLTTYSSTFTLGSDVDAPTGNSTPAAGTYNSLRFNSAGAYAVNPAGNITIATGGILETGNVGGSPLTIGAAATTNTLTSGNGQDLIVLANDQMGSLTINSAIANDGGAAVGLTKSGNETLTITNAETYTGPTTVNTGILALKETAPSPLADTAITVNSGATLAFQPAAAGTYSFGSTATAGAGASLMLISGATLDMTDAKAETLDIQQGSAFAGPALTLSGATLKLDLTNTGTTAADNLVVTGTATASGVNTLILILPNSGALATGFLPLITAAVGSTLNAGSFVFYNGTSSESAIVGGTNYTLTLNSTATAVDLDIMFLGTQTLTWTGRNGGSGAANSSWDTTAASTNWSTSPAGPSSFSSYLDGDTVTFGDANPIANAKVPNTAGLAMVTIQSGGVQPKAITFTNTGSGSGGVDYSLGNAAGGTFGIAGQTGITLAGTSGVGGTVILTGANTFSGPVQINAGQLNVQNSGALGSSSGVTVANGGALVLQGSVSIPSTIPLNLSGAGWTTTPAGALASASGSNFFAGPITLAANATIGSSSTAAGDGLTLGGGIDTGSSGFTLDFIGPGNTTVNGAISDGGGVNIGGTGTVNFTSPNTFAGAALISSGQLVLMNNGALGNSSGATVLSGAAQVLNTGTGNTGTYGNASTPITLSLAGAGLTANPAGALNSLTGNNSYVGPINVEPGGATINSSSTATGDGLTLSGPIDVPGPSPLTFKGAGSAIVSGVISGNGGLVYSGTGTLTLNGAAGNTYGTSSVGTTISSGTVAVANSNIALGAGPVTLSGGRLQLQGLPTGANGIGVHIAADQDPNGAGASGQLPFTIGTSVTAGVVPMSNWNDLVITRFTLANSNVGQDSNSSTPPPAQGTVSSSSIPLALNTSSGASSGAAVSAWSGAFTFTVYEASNASVTATPNATLVNGYLGAISPNSRSIAALNNSAVVTISGIPYASYSAYVYFNSSVPDSTITLAATGQISITTSNASGNNANTSPPVYVASLGQTTTGNPYNASAGTYTFTQATGGTLGTLTINGTNPGAASGNYVEFTGLSGGPSGIDDILTTTLAADSSNTSYLIGLTAIEIVENGGGSGGMVMTNSVNVTANSTIDETGTSAATLGNLTITSTPTTPTVLSVTGGSTGVGVAYTLTLGTVTLVGGSATFNVANNGTGTAAGAGTLVLGAIGDNGSGFGITLLGGGTLDLATGSTYSGHTTIQNGILNISGDSSLGMVPANPAANIVFSGNVGTPTLQFNAAYTGTLLSTNRGIAVDAGDIGYVDTNGNPLITYAGLITVGSSGTFGKTGLGTFELDAPPNLGNGSILAVNGGTLRLKYGNEATIGTNVSATVSSGGILELAGSASQLNQTVNIANAGGLLVSSSGSQTVGTIVGGTQANPLGGTTVNAGGSLTAYQIVQNSLTIGSGATVTLAPSGSGSTTNPTGPNNINFSSTLTSLSIAGTTGAWTGTLDIGNNGLVIEYGTGSDPYSTIDNMIETGFDAAHWDGTGITSSLGRAAANSHTPLNIGLEDFTPGKGNFSNTTFIVFEGQTVATDAILIRLTYMDDIVLAGDLNAQDASSDALIFAANYGTGTTWSVGDLEHTGLVGSADALLFAANYTPPLASLDGTTGGAAELGSAMLSGAGGSPVPEPASILLAALGASCLALAARQRRRWS